MSAGFAFPYFYSADYDALPQAPTFLPLTPFGMRKLRRAEAAKQAHAECAMANLEALNEIDRAWLAEHGLEIERELSRHRVQMMMEVSYR